MAEALDADGIELDAAPDGFDVTDRVVESAAAEGSAITYAAVDGDGFVKIDHETVTPGDDLVPFGTPVDIPGWEGAEYRDGSPSDADFWQVESDGQRILIAVSGLTYDASRVGQLLDQLQPDDSALES